MTRTEAGERTRECKVCGHVDKGTIKKLPHSFGEWEDITPATDHSSGVRARTCEMCGTQETEEYDPEGTLRRGDKGDDVKELQEGLICYGTLKGRADGSYGKGTERAVRALQEAEGMEADGVAPSGFMVPSRIFVTSAARSPPLLRSTSILPCFIR